VTDRAPSKITTLYPSPEFHNNTIHSTNIMLYSIHYLRYMTYMAFWVLVVLLSSGDWLSLYWHIFYYNFTYFYGDGWDWTQDLLNTRLVH
jgi:hypothetical protein